MHADERYARTEDGLRLYVRAVGDGGPAVLVPGACDSEEDLAPLAAARRACGMPGAESVRSADRWRPGQLILTPAWRAACRTCSQALTISERSFRCSM